MQNTSPKPTNHQEIDLVILFRKIKDFFQSIRFGIYKFIQFCLNKIIYIISLIVLGGVVGFFMDSNLPQQYKHETIVAVNFNSAEYLYKFINSKEVNNGKITKVEIAPIIDIFSVISNNEEHLKALSFLNEVGFDFSKYKKGSPNIFLYRYHLLTIYTNGIIEDPNFVTNFLKNINEDPYFINKQKIEFANNKFKIEEYKKSIQNINSIFENANQVKSSSTVDITNFDQMSDLTKTKSTLINQLNILETELIEQQSTIYPTVIKNNIVIDQYGYLIKPPFFLLIIFFGFSWLRYWFNKTKQAYILKDNK